MKPIHTITRRDAIRTLGLGVAAVAGVGRGTLAAGSPDRLSAYALDPLPYAYGALEPHIDALTMQIHHGRHHQAYINNARRILEPWPEWAILDPKDLLRRIGDLPKSIRQGARDNVGGHVNHAMFWKLLTPESPGSPVGSLAPAINRTFGSFETFKERFAAAAAARFGSGWAWLSVKDGKLYVHSTPNQDSPYSEGAVPVLGLDVWEHAYYLHYQNRRGDYVSAFWSIVNWDQAEKNYRTAIA